MRIAYLDCFSGISGDMFLGALVDAGVPAQLFEETVAALNVGARLEISRVNRSGISATKVDVYAHGEKDLPREVYWEQRERNQRGAPSHDDHRHPHDGHDHHDHNHASSPATTAKPKKSQHSHEHDHSHEHGRGLKEIRQIIEQAAISATAKKTAIQIFEALGAAEAKIHNSDIEKVHFHEVGAVDAMVDIVCAAVGAEALRVDAIVASPLNVGGGTVKCAHGTFPVPAPATLELLKSAPVYSSSVQAELVTPTGAAIIATLASRFAAFPSMTIENTGYGAGTRDFPGYPNVVRLTIGESQEELPAGTSRETITVLEANLDDLNPQIFAYVVERLLQEGALDAYGVPVQMKKGRPGMVLTVLCKNENVRKLNRLILSETTTLGVRRRQEERETLTREWTTVATPWGDVRIKVAWMNGQVTNSAPEFEDCKRIAKEHGVPLKAVMQEAMQTYGRAHNENPAREGAPRKAVSKIS